MNFIRVGKIVKWTFCLAEKVGFQAQDPKGNHNLLGVAPASRKLLFRATHETWEFAPIIA